MRHRSTATSADTPRARVRMCRWGWTSASTDVNSPDRTISSARLWSVVSWVMLAVVEPVGTGVTHVDQGQDIPAVLIDQPHGGEGGAHPPQFGVLQTVLPDHAVGLGDRLGQTGAGRLPAEGGAHRIDGHPGRHLAPGVATHPVGHGEQVGRLHGQVLVDRAHQAGVGGRARPEKGHLTSRLRTRCRRSAGDHPFRGGCAHRSVPC